MALRNVNGPRGTKKATDLQIGEIFSGYVLRVEDSTKIEGQKNMVIRLPDGTDVLFFSAGNLKYMLTDGKIQTGIYTEIKRVEDTTIKGKKASRFEVQQDDEIKLDEATFDAVFAGQEASKPLAANLAAAVSGNGKISSDRAALKAQAEKLKNSMNR